MPAGIKAARHGEIPQHFNLAHVWRNGCGAADRRGFGRSDRDERSDKPGVRCTPQCEVKPVVPTEMIPPFVTINRR